MKKLGVLLVAVAVFGGLYIFKPSNSNMNQAALGASGKKQSAEQAQSSTEVSVAASALPLVREREVSKNVPQAPHGTRKLSEVKTFTELHREYVNYKTEELRHVLGWSEARLNDSGLMKKSASGGLSDQETYVLLTEVRRQTVIKNILAERALTDFERMRL